jgi:hypothetical protein
MPLQLKQRCFAWNIEDAREESSLESSRVLLMNACPWI